MQFTATFLNRCAAQLPGEVSVEGDTERDNFRGIPIVIENRKGTYREGTDPDGHDWSVLMHGDYGYIPSTEAAGDKEGLDVFIGDDKSSDYAYVVEQLYDGEFDEYKVVLGCPDLQTAEALYLSNYEEGWEEEGHVGEISEVPLDYLFDAVEDHQKTGASDKNVPRSKYDKVCHAIATDDALWDYFCDYVQVADAFEDNPGASSRIVELVRSIPPFIPPTIRKCLYRGEEIRMGDDRLPAVWEPHLRDLLSWTVNYDTARQFAGNKGIVWQTVGKIQGIALEDIVKWRNWTHPNESNYSGMQAEWFVLNTCKAREAPWQKITAADTNLIDRFVAQYTRQRRLYSKAADVIRGEINDACAKRNIRAAITARAKTPESLRNKLIKRNEARPYQGVKDILADIKDMAGVRVALYFPIDREAVGQIIGEMYEQARPPKHFPEDRDPGEPEGYEATHYAVKYAGLVVEIQVASALMYAWAEVSHDFIYKPRMGEVTPTELQLLDELKSIVKSGEHTVMELQQLVQNRTAKASPSLMNYVRAILAARERILSIKPQAI